MLGHLLNSGMPNINPATETHLQCTLQRPGLRLHRLCGPLDDAVPFALLSPTALFSAAVHPLRALNDDVEPRARATIGSSWSDLMVMSPCWAPISRKGASARLAGNSPVVFMGKAMHIFIMVKRSQTTRRVNRRSSPPPGNAKSKYTPSAPASPVSACA